MSWPGTVLYDKRDGKFRCWYSGFDAVQTPDRFWKHGYAESEDGIHWVKPSLGQVEYLDRPTNQMHFDWEGPMSMLICVFINPAPDAPPSQRFGALFTERAPDIGKSPAFRKSLAWSPDGQHWTRETEAYSAKIQGDMHGDPFQDIYQLLFQPEAPDPIDRVIGYGQHMAPSWDGKHVRNIGWVHGSDPAHLTNGNPIFSLKPEKGIDEEVHFASVKRVGGTYLMLFESDRFSHNPIHGNLRLAVSQDGRQFRRVHPAKALVATGTKGMWDENLLVTSTSAIQEVGDELYIFYFGCPNVYNSWPPRYAVTSARRGSMFYPVYLGLATLPRDRYAYAAGPGCMTIRSSAGASTLLVNAEGGGLGIEARNLSGGKLASGRLFYEAAGVYRRVAWDTPPTDEPADITFTLGKGTKLYSYSFSDK
ncbi:MAG: hypothetical protein WAX69_16360 [Victivallales bacterium]